MTTRRLLLFLFISLTLCLSCKSLAQGAYIDLTLVESSNYNKSLANFSHESFQNAFKISSLDGDEYEVSLEKALTMFLELLEPQKSYIIQHEPTYYFVFQYNKKNLNYLIMNNSIGEKNEAIFCNAFDDAKKQMLILLQGFYSNIPIFTVKEYK